MDGALVQTRIGDPWLGERLCFLNPSQVRSEGAYVLCWLHHAIRDRENPALDTALRLGNRLGRPVLVYQGLGGRHRFNSARHHTFILEGARELAAALANRGIASVFHLPRSDAAPSPLRRLAAQACAVITEDFPAPPFPAWTESLARRAPVAVVAVDCACIAPMRLIEAQHARAFAFRDAAEPLWRPRLHHVWPEVEPEVPMLDTASADLGFEPVDWATEIDDLVAACDIDHAVPPVPQTPGGMSAAEARWSAFKRDGLASYADRRNDAADVRGVSRMSAYLHHGHASPFKLAREAAASRGAGPAKFLDELLTWRELAFNFCLHQPAGRLETLDALPRWAVATLRDRQVDPRERLHEWESLLRGRTGDALWDAAQRSLLRNGELHNNLRMTWGKALVPWTRDASAALDLLIDLNHRLALDGNNPNSYGGLLWCLGQFDRPFSPPQPVFGSVRTRPTNEHARRLDPARFDAAVRDFAARPPLTVCVIGAGVAGLACARTLQDHGANVTVLERGRGPGGRAATRRAPLPDGREVHFDHGAPAFAVTDHRFGGFVRSWVERGVAAWWTPRRVDARGAERPTPAVAVCPGGMRNLAAHLAADLRPCNETRAVSIKPEGRRWSVETENGGQFGAFDAVVVAMPPAQAEPILPRSAVDLRAACAEADFEPAWSLMLAVNGRGLRVDMVEPGDGVIACATRQEGKPGFRGHDDLSCWVIHATPDWSRPRLDEAPEAVAEALGAAAIPLIGAAAGYFGEIVHASAHRWKFAQARAPRPGPRALATSDGLILCGDWLGGTGIEGAFLSGQAAAGRALRVRDRVAAAAAHHGVGA